MKIEIHKHIHEKLKMLAQANQITIQTLANELLNRTLNRHKNELKEIIQQIKQRE